MQALATKKKLCAKHRLSNNHNTNALNPRTPKYFSLAQTPHIRKRGQMLCLENFIHKCIINNINQYLQQFFEMLRLTQFAKNIDGPSPSHTHKLLNHYVIGRLCKKLETT
jgi:hypothetical protein